MRYTGNLEVVRVLGSWFTLLALAKGAYGMASYRPSEPGRIFTPRLLDQTLNQRVHHDDGPHTSHNYHYLHELSKYWAYPYDYHHHAYSTAQTQCTCDCRKYWEPSEKSTERNFGEPKESYEKGCEWKMVFKATKGNGRHVYADWMNGGDINTDVPEATRMGNPLPYRNGAILDHWNQHYIKEVLIEVFQGGVKGTWFYFDATASDMNNWMSRDRLIDAPFDDIKDGEMQTFSVEGEVAEERRFAITRASAACTTDCGFLMVIDPAPFHDCGYERLEPEPYFLYSSNPIQQCVSPLDTGKQTASLYQSCRSCCVGEGKRNKIDNSGRGWQTACVDFYVQINKGR